MFARSLRSFDGGFKGATREPKAPPAAFPDATDKNNNDFFENYSEKVNFFPPFCFSFFSLLDLSY